MQGLFEPFCVVVLSDGLCFDYDNRIESWMFHAKWHQKRPFEIKESFQLQKSRGWRYIISLPASVQNKHASPRYYHTRIGHDKRAKTPFFWGGSSGLRSKPVPCILYPILNNKYEQNKNVVTFKIPSFLLCWYYSYDYTKLRHNKSLLLRAFCQTKPWYFRLYQDTT